MAALVALLVSTARADDGEASEPVSYYRDVQPLLREHCQGCHQPAKAGGDVVLTSHGFLTGKLSVEGADDDDDPTVVPGKPQESLLIEEITPRDGKASMPKGKPPLAAAKIELISRWIREGAKDDTPASERVQYSSENPPVYLSPPVITGLDFSADGKYLAVSGNNEVLLHRADGSGIEARLVGLSERIESVAFSPDSKLLAVTGGSPARVGELQVWDVGRRKLRLSHPVTFDTIYGASWSVDGTRVAFGCADTSVRVVDVKTGKQVLFQGAHNDWVLDTVFSKDASHLVTVSRDRSMKLIVVATEQFVDNITSITPGALKGGLMAIDRHPEKDELLVGGADGVPKIYRMFREKARKIGDDFNLIRNFERLPGRVFSVEFSPDASRIVAGSSLDGTGEVRVFQVADGKRVSRVAFESTSIYTVTFSSDGRLVAAAGFDGAVRLIDAATGKVEKEFSAVPVQSDQRSF